MTATPRLTYFELRGRAEAIRVFLHAMGASFEDRRVVAQDEWNQLKPTLPFGGLPIYESNELHLCQSHAILRHLGRTVTPELASDGHVAERDIAQEALSEAQEDLWRFAWRKNYNEHLDSYARDTLRPRLERLSRWLERSGGSVPAFGGAFSFVDCIAFAFLDEVDAFFPALLEQFPALSEHRARIASLSGVSDYLASAARPIVFGMGCMGPKVDPRVTLEPGCSLATPWSAPIDLGAVARTQRRLSHLEPR